MDKPVKKGRPAGSGPVVAFANWFQFGPGERIVSPRVESRMFLWCSSGGGRVRVNQRWFSLEADDWVLMPWLHDTLYEADATRPFLVGAVHVIPEHDSSVPVVFGVAHHATDALANLPHRRDTDWPLLGDVVNGRFGENDGLRLLGNYIVETFHRRTPVEWRLRSLAGLLIAELQQDRRAGPLRSAGLPAPLRKMQEYVRSHLAKSIGVAELAGLAGISPATVNRLFRQATAKSPRAWIAGLRFVEAQRLLRTTNAAVQEVGLRVGFSDPYHFSRFFKRLAGAAPSDYRRRCKIL